MVLDKLRKVFGGSGNEPEYIEIDLGKEVKKSKVKEVVKWAIKNIFHV